MQGPRHRRRQHRVHPVHKDKETGGEDRPGELVRIASRFHFLDSGKFVIDKMRGLPSQHQAAKRRSRCRQ